MAVQLEALNLRVTGSADGLSATLGKAQQDIQGFSGRVGGIFSKISSSLSAAAASPIGAAVLGSIATLTAGAVAAGAAVAKIRDEFDKIDESSKVAAQLGITLNELIGLRAAIDESSAALDVTAIDASLKKLQLNLQEAKNGSGAAKEALDKLGLDAGQLLAVGPVEQLKILADRFQDVDSASERAKLAFELFGKSGAGVATLLASGRDAIEESANFAQRWLGITEAQSQAVQQANDSIGRIGVIIEGITRHLAVELAPAAKVIADEIIAWAEAGSEVSQSFGGIDTVVQVLTDNLTTMLGLTLDIAEVQYGNLIAAGQALSGDISGAFQTFKAANDIDNLRRLTENLAEARREAAEAAKESSSSFNADSIEESASALEKWKQTAESIRDSLATPIEKYQERIDQLTGAVKNGGLEIEVFAKGVEKAFADLQAAQAKTQDSKITSTSALLRNSEAGRTAELNLALGITPDATAIDRAQETAAKVQEEIAKLQTELDKGSVGVESLASKVKTLNDAPALTLPSQLAQASDAAETLDSQFESIIGKLREMDRIGANAVVPSQSVANSSTIAPVQQSIQQTVTPSQAVSSAENRLLTEFAKSQQEQSQRLATAIDATNAKLDVANGRLGSINDSLSNLTSPQPVNL